MPIHFEPATVSRPLILRAPAGSDRAKGLPARRFAAVSRPGRSLEVWENAAWAFLALSALLALVLSFAAWASHLVS